MSALLSAHAQSTRRQYATGWARWELFCASRPLNSPFLTREGGASALRREENLLLDFAVWQHHLQKGEGTIRSSLYAVRFRHITEGLPDPLAGRPRLWLLLKSLRRKGKPTRRKYPVTMSMIREIKRMLHERTPEAIEARSAADVLPEDAPAMWAGILTAFLFLLRGGEWLAHDGRGYDTAKVILGAGMVAYSQGSRVDAFSQANEIVAELRASKMDQYNTGTWRNHFRTDEDICLLVAMEALQRAHPERFGTGSEILKPLFRRARGGPILASQVKSLLDRAAVAVGLPPDRMGTHSLRIGGASALLHAGFISK